MNEQQVIREVRREYTRYDSRAKAWIESYTAKGGRLYCASGCFRCCDMPIRISWLEALTIAQSMTEEQFDAMTEHARKVWRNAHASEDGDAYVASHRKHVGFCPLLDRETGSCTQYANRPTRCRDTYSGLPARFCAPDGLQRLSRGERREYARTVREHPAMDGESHFLAPLEDLSLPAWKKFSEVMRRELGVEVWGDFAFLVAMTREEDFRDALKLRNKRAVIGALKGARLYHPEILQIE